ncbi:MAG: response regulator [Proteobacteria bacterium]|nr:response regulator [Pseudomonadota bacterium]
MLAFLLTSFRLMPHSVNRRRKRKLLHEHPDVAGRLVAPIPRLELVAAIIRHQAKEAPADAPLEVVRGAQLLRPANAVEEPIRVRGLPGKSAP